MFGYGYSDVATQYTMSTWSSSGALAVPAPHRTWQDGQGRSYHELYDSTVYLVSTGTSAPDNRRKRQPGGRLLRHGRGSCRRLHSTTVRLSKIVQKVAAVVSRTTDPGMRDQQPQLEA